MEVDVDSMEAVRVCVAQATCLEQVKNKARQRPK